MTNSDTTEGGRQLTLTASLSDVLRRERPLASGYTVRPTTRFDADALANLYFDAYSRDTVHGAAAAREEIELTFQGEYGQLELASSPLIKLGDDVVAAVMTVEEAPWTDTPPGPFIIEVMVRPVHRRLGLAEFALQEAARSLVSAGKRTVALRVMSDNAPAVDLYRKLGFTGKDEV